MGHRDQWRQGQCLGLEFRGSQALGKDNLGRPIGEVTQGRRLTYRFRTPDWYLRRISDPAARCGPFVLTEYRKFMAARLQRRKHRFEISLGATFHTRECGGHGYAHAMRRKAASVWRQGETLVIKALARHGQPFTPAFNSTQFMRHEVKRFVITHWHQRERLQPPTRSALWIRPSW